MAASAKPHKLGWVRPSRLHSRTSQVKAAEAAGCVAVYIDGEDGVDLAHFLTRPRPGEVVYVATFGRLGNTRAALRHAMRVIVLERKATIQEASGRTVTTARDIEVFSGAIDAAEELAREARAPTKREAKRRGKLGGEATAALHKEKRMPEAQARPIWKAKDGTSLDDRIARMPGWNVWTAYRKFDKSGAPLGRQKQKKR